MSIKRGREIDALASSVSQTNDGLSISFDPAGLPSGPADPLDLTELGMVWDPMGLPLDPNTGAVIPRPAAEPPASGLVLPAVTPAQDMGSIATGSSVVPTSVPGAAPSDILHLAAALPVVAPSVPTSAGNWDIAGSAQDGDASTLSVSMASAGVPSSSEILPTVPLMTVSDPPGPVESLGSLLLVAGLSDKTGPSLDGSTTSDDTIAGRAIDTAAIVSLTAAIDGGVAVDETSDVGPDGRFSFTPAMIAALAGGSLADGQHTVVVSATDASGNETSVDVVFALDSVAPILSAGLPDITGTSTLAQGVGATSNDTITGTVTDPAGIINMYGTLDGSANYTDLTGSIGTNGTFTITPSALASLAGGTLPDGDNSLVLLATDAAGNAASQTIDFRLLTQIAVPMLALASADQTTNATTTDASAITLVGQAGPGDTVLLVSTGATTVANTAGTFQFDNIPLSVGDNQIEVQASDLANNTSGDTLTVQATAPSGGTDPVLQWDQITLQAITTDADAPTVASRALAMESLAVYDAVSAIDGTPGYLVNLTAASDASAPAAVAEAADQVLDYLYPAQAAAFDAQLAVSLSVIPAGQARFDGIALGAEAAQAIIALRANDGSQTTVTDNGVTRGRAVAADRTRVRQCGYPAMGQCHALRADQPRSVPGSAAARHDQCGLCSGGERNRVARCRRQHNEDGGRDADRKMVERPDRHLHAARPMEFDRRSDSPDAGRQHGDRRPAPR